MTRAESWCRARGIELMKQDGFSHKEIAETFKMTETHVRTKLSQMRKEGRKV